MFDNLKHFVMKNLQNTRELGREKILFSQRQSNTKRHFKKILVHSFFFYCFLSRANLVFPNILLKCVKVSLIGDLSTCPGCENEHGETERQAHCNCCL